MWPRCEALRRFSAVNEARVFGSRATGQARRASDLDLAVFAPRASFQEWAEICEALENAPVIYELDLVRGEHITNERLKEKIESEGVIIYLEEMSMSVTDLPIHIDREKIVEFCVARGIRRLSLFGSVLRDDFDPARSDIDVLAELLPTAQPGWKFFGWHEDLAPIFGRKVDLHTPASLSRYFRDEVLREALTVYEQA